MEDLIILALFILASLASYISKLRESKRRKKAEAEEGQYSEELGWPEVSFEPELKPIAESSPPASATQRQQRYSDRSPEPRQAEKTQPSAESKRFVSTQIEQVPPARKPISADNVAESVPDAAYTVKVGYVERKFGNYELSSISRLKGKKYVKINIKSKSSFQKAIITREILDRPRAFDI